ncbi:MAG: hypothetical protein U0230_01715 [Polyangiales bacterium]
MAQPKRIALLLLAVAGILVPGGTASADCPPGTRFCAQVQVNGGVYVQRPASRVVVQINRPAPPPTVVYAQAVPPPPVVYANPQPPPPVVVQQPAPPVVVVRPAPPPPPPMVVVPPPQQQTVYVRPAPRQTVIVRTGGSVGYGPRPATGQVGLHFSLGGAGGSGAALGGFSGALRIRPVDHFAIDLGVGTYGGRDYYDNNRIEVPLTLDGLFFVNPQNVVQLYVVGGPGFSFGLIENTAGSGVYDHRYTYFGGSLGGGLEFRIRPGFALNLEARGFMRYNFAGTTPEYVSSTGNTTNTSAGWMASGGLTVYF